MIATIAYLRGTGCKKWLDCLTCIYPDCIATEKDIAGYCDAPLPKNYWDKHLLQIEE